MPRNGSGTYSLPAGNPVVSHTTITTTWANSTLPDIATALTGSIAKNGETTPTAALPMGGFNHSGVGLATLPTNYARASQLQDQSLSIATSVTMGAADVYSALLAFGETSFATGLLIQVTFPNSNTTTSPTLAINAGTATPIKRADGSGIRAGDIVAGVPQFLAYIGTSWNLQGTPPANLKTATVTATALVTTGQVTLSAYSALPVAGVLAFGFHQTQVWDLVAPITITSISGIDLGNTGYILLNSTTGNAITWPATVKWGLADSGVQPNLAAGTLKQAKVSLFYDGTNYLAQAVVY